MTPHVRRSAARVGAQHCAGRQEGAAAVEFALVFPTLFLLVYGVIVYSYMYVMQQAITYAAQEAAEAAVSVDPALDDAATVRDAVVRSTAVSALSWLPESQQARVLGTDGQDVVVTPCPAGGADCPVDSDALRVTLQFVVRTSSCGQDSLFPVFNLFGMGCIPPLPQTLRATAVVRI